MDSRPVATLRILEHLRPKARLPFSFGGGQGGGGGCVCRGWLMMEF